MASEDTGKEDACVHVPPPETRQYGEHIERQTQAALDVALAHPVARVFFGFLAICFFVAWLSIIEAAMRDRPVWLAALYIVGVSSLFIPIALELGHIAVFGKSRSQWLMRKWRAPRSH